MVSEKMVVKIAVIGVGGWGKNHLRVLSKINCLTAFCDINRERVNLYQKQYGIKGYDSVDELLSNEDLDAVTICTPTITHGELAKKTLVSGLHTFVEKPLAHTSSECEDLADLADKMRLTLTSGYIERFNPAVSDLKTVIDSKRLGSLLLLEFHRENKWAGNIIDVGIVTDTSVHDIDTARWLFKKEPNMVFARTGSAISDYEDFAAIILGFGDQKTAFIASNWITPKKVRQVIAVCSNGIATVDFITQELKIDDENGTSVPKNRWKEPLLMEMKNFIGCIEKKHRPMVTSRDAINTTKIAEAALTSSKTGTPIYLKL